VTIAKRSMRLVLAVAALLCLASGPALAAPITLVPDTLNMFRDTRGLNDVGIAQGDVFQYGADIQGGAAGSTLGATYPPTGFTQPQFQCNPLAVNANFCSRATPFTSARIAVPWSLRFENGPDALVVSGPALAGVNGGSIVEQVPFPRSVTITAGATPQTPTISWTLPGGFVPDGFRVNIFDKSVILPSGIADVIHTIAIPPTATSYTIPAVLNSGQTLALGGRYSINFQLIETRDHVPFTNNNAQILRRSSSFFAFTPTAAGTPDVHLPQVGPDPNPGDNRGAPYVFSLEIPGPDSVVFIDPVVAVGYDYATGPGNPNFASVTLPAVGDGVFEVLVAGESHTVLAGTQFFFPPGGVATFGVRGIEVSAGLDPTDVTAFVTGLTFVQAGQFTGTMTPILASTIGLETPVISGAPASPTRQTAATFEFSDADPTATFLCALDDDAPAAFAPCSSPTTYGAAPGAPLAAGTHTFRVKARDLAGAESDVASHTWTIDLAAPALAFSGVPLDPSNSTGAAFSFFASEASTFVCQLDEQAPEPCSPDPTAPGDRTRGTRTYAGLDAGPHAFTVTATDGAGNEATLAFGWTIDLTAPALAITSAPLDPTSSNTASFAFETNEPSNFVCRLTGPVAQGPAPCSSMPGTTGMQTYAGLGDGAYAFTVTATDLGGNVATASFSWVVDQTPPAVTIDTPASGAAYLVGASVTAAYTCADGLSGVASCVGSVPGGSPIDTATAGSKTFTVTATDRAGNSATRTVTYSVTAAAAGPDLVETAVVAHAASVTAGGLLAVSDTAANQGTRIALLPTLTLYYLSPTPAKGPGATLLVGGRLVPPLKPGETSAGKTVVIVPKHTPAGAYHVVACADDLKLVKEANEANNCTASATTLRVNAARH
jgi:hypothetical protein